MIVEFGCLKLSFFFFNILATCKVMLVCSAAPQGDQATGTMTGYPAESHYPDTELTSPCPILMIPSAQVGSDKYKFGKSFV